MIFAAGGHKTTISYDEATGRTIACDADFSLASEAVTGIYNKVLARNYDSTPGVKGRMNQVSWNIGGTADPGNPCYSNGLNQTPPPSSPKLAYNCLMA
ncbi:MAG: hypothetical protein HZB23_04385 [Deltaproteobacteria bacterium]|nr:hypothetical protein [Deltaproteobacteria bacterium]